MTSIAADLKQFVHQRFVRARLVFRSSATCRRPRNAFVDQAFGGCRKMCRSPVRRSAEQGGRARRCFPCASDRAIRGAGHSTPIPISFSLPGELRAGRRWFSARLMNEVRGAAWSTASAPTCGSTRWAIAGQFRPIRARSRRQTSCGRMARMATKGQTRQGWTTPRPICSTTTRAISPTPWTPPAYRIADRGLGIDYVTRRQGDRRRHIADTRAPPSACSCQRTGSWWWGRRTRSSCRVRRSSGTAQN